MIQNKPQIEFNRFIRKSESGSYWVTIPKEIAESLLLEKDTPAMIYLNDRKIIIEVKPKNE